MQTESGCLTLYVRSKDQNGNDGKMANATPCFDEHRTPSPTVVVALSFAKCDHLPEGKIIISSVPGNFPMRMIFDEHHPTLADYDKKYALKAHTPTSSGDFEVDVDGSVTIRDLNKQFDVKSLKFSCIRNATTKGGDLLERAQEATRKTIDAFQILMAGGRAFVPKKTSRFVYIPWYIECKL